MIKVIAKDCPETTETKVIMSGDCEKVLNEYRAIIFAVARGVVEPIKDEDDRALIKSELMRMYAEAASNLCKL